MFWFILGVILMVIYIFVKIDEIKTKKEVAKYNIEFEINIERRIKKLSDEEAMLTDQIKVLKHSLSSKTHEINAIKDWLSSHNMEE